MTAKRKWEVGAVLTLTAVVAIAVAFLVRYWLLNEALVKAVWDSDPQEVRSLLRQGADPNHRDRQFHQAMVTYSLNSGATLKVLLQGGANPDTPFLDGQVPLVRAARSSYHDVVRILLRYGADVNGVDAQGQTALTAAAQAADSPALVRTLLEAGAKVSHTDRRGKSAIDITRVRLGECGKGIGEKWRAETARRQRVRRTEILRMLEQAKSRQTVANEL